MLSSSRPATRTARNVMPRRQKCTVRCRKCRKRLKGKTPGKFRARLSENRGRCSDIRPKCSLVTSDRPDEYIGKKGLVKNQVITCQDVDPFGYRLLMPFDYTLSEDGKGKF